MLHRTMESTRFVHLAHQWHLVSLVEEPPQISVAPSKTHGVQPF